MSEVTVPSTAKHADVELRLPADGAYASVLRTTSAALAARIDFTIDDIEDLRIVVSEASSLVLDYADPESDLHCAYALAPGSMTLTLTVATEDNPVPDLDNFAWQVLSALAESADLLDGEGTFAVRVSMVTSASTGA
ncbi:anti-sigma factor [Nocardioides sp. R-C-SC26]|uniref:anti-sigma factor n=1 Tax=Nocardioides sp. R-C-SC26 TaxID=2870414 RepID=UPI001E64B060|nr:anti-sigma factor [Nocardioides sp. R-C-SC26]